MSKAEESVANETFKKGDRTFMTTKSLSLAIEIDDLIKGNPANLVLRLATNHHHQKRNRENNKHTKPNE